MRIRTRIRIAFDMCLNEGWLFLLGTAVAVAAFSMFGWMFQMSSHAGSYEDRVRSAIRVPAEDIGYIYIDADVQAKKEISGKIAELSEIEAIGTMNYGVFNTSEAVAFLGEVQKGHQKAVRDEDHAARRGIETCVMSKGAWDIMNMKLSSGKAPEEFVFKENTILLYLSEEYRDIAELGEHFYEIYEKDGSVIYDYEVAGFLSGGSRVLADGVGNSVDELINRGYYTTEYAIIEVTDSPFLSGGYFVIKDGESFEMVREKITDIGRGYKAEITVNKLDSVLRYARERTRAVSKYLLELSCLLGAAAMILLVSIQIGRVVSRSREYGIWLTNGASMKDILLMILYQNILYIFPSLLLSLVVVYRFTLKFASDSEAAVFVRESLWKAALPLMFLLGILVTAVISLIPVRLLVRSNAVSLMKGELD